MKRKFFYLIILVFVLIIYFTFINTNSGSDFVDNADNRYETEAEGWLKFVDENDEYSVHYPADWKLEDSSFRNEMIRADISKNGHTGVQIRMINARETELSVFSDHYLDNFLTEMNDYWQGEIKEVNRTYTYLGENYGCRSEITMNKGNGEEWLFLEYIWLRHEYALAFQCGTKLEKRSEQVPQLDQIASSLSFLK